MITDKKLAIEKLKTHLINLDFIDESLWLDKDFISDVLDIMFMNTYMMRKRYSIRLSKNISLLKDDNDIAEKMMRVYIGLYDFLPEEQKTRAEIEKILIDCTESTGLMYLKEERKTRDVVLETIENNIDNYNYIPEFLKTDEEIIKMVSKKKIIFTSLKEEQINNTELMCELIRLAYIILTEHKKKMNIFEKSQLIGDFEAMFKNKDVLESSKDIGFVKELHDADLKDNINMNSIGIINSNNFDKITNVLPMIIENIENKKLRDDLLKKIPARDNKSKTKLKF